MKKLWLALLFVPVFSYAGVWDQFHNTSDRNGLSSYIGANCCDHVCSTKIEYSYASPAIDGAGHVYLAGCVPGTGPTGPWALWCVNDNDCSVRWSLVMGNSPNMENPTSTCAISGDSVIYLGSIIDTCLWAVYSTGTVKWTYRLSGRMHSSAALSPDGSIIYVTSDSGHLYAINSDKTLGWRYSSGSVGFTTSSPALGSDGTLYFGAANGTVHAVTSAGTLKWSYPTGEPIWSSPSIGSDGTVYIGSNDNKLYAINSSDGSLKWSYTTSGDVKSSPAIDQQGGLIYVGSDDQHLYAINISDGTLRWSVALTGRPGLSSPAIASPEHIIYIGDATMSGDKIYVVRNRYSYGEVLCTRQHDWDITSPAVGNDTSIWYNEYSMALHKIKCYNPLCVEENNYKKGVKLGDNSPNPFFGETSISFTIPEKSYVRLGIYDLSGRLIKELINGDYSAGTYNIKWDARDKDNRTVNAGVYLYKLRANSMEIIRKMTVIDR